MKLLLMIDILYVHFLYFESVDLDYERHLLSIFKNKIRVEADHYKF